MRSFIFKSELGEAELQSNLVFKMKILVRVLSVILLIVLTCSYFELTIEGRVFPDGVNAIKRTYKNLVI